MDWWAAVDLYCERVAPGLAGEPLNAVTNLAFFAAAWGVAWRCRQSGQALDAELRLLLALVVAVGAGSLAFHAAPSRLTGALDTGAIALFLVTWSVLYLRRQLDWPWRLAWLGVPGFCVLAALAHAGWKAAGLQPAAYLAAWTVLLLALAHAAWRRSPGWPAMALAALAFPASMTLRQLDAPLCSLWPHGTHFAWHLLNALTLAFACWALARRGPPPAARRGPGSGRAAPSPPATAPRPCGAAARTGAPPPGR